MSAQGISCQPFLKWAGGKRWITRSLIPLMNKRSGLYIEPFLGSGASFFALSPTKAVLADSNKELINAFVAVRDQPESLIRCLWSLEVDRFTFDVLKSLRVDDPVSRAARFVYLNRTAFNGLYRVNREGAFNVPFGCKPGTKSCDKKQIRACSAALQAAEILATDFRVSLQAVPSGSVVFLDPPYTVKHNDNGFRRYNERIFAWADQVDLAQIASDLVAAGTRVIVTNAWHRELVDLYDMKQFFALRIMRPSNMAAVPTHRGTFAELLLVSRNAVRSLRSLKLLLASSLVSAAPRGSGRGK